MSKALDIADLIRTRIITAPASGELATPVDLTLLSDEIIVDRQKNLTTEVAKAVAKAGGTGVTILWDGFGVRDQNAKRPAMEESYTIRIYSKPIITDGNFPADDVVESVINRLWHWVPEGGHQHREAQVQPGGLIPDRSYLIYEFGVQVPAFH